ncbi:MAG: hypothetical protein M1834_000990 [Cirrosporium novae-zelandiae]|nr:MAG: hypothetical protein M1834_000990 [Cirrosporium novae-zelandiae]
MSGWVSKQPSRQSHSSHHGHHDSYSADSLYGHLGHLSEAQEHAFARFKELCSNEKLYSPGQGEQPSSHDDATMIRFLRARRFEPHAAFEQFKETEIWRKENKLQELYDNIDVETYEEARKMYPQWVGRRDKRGIPVYVYTIRHLTSKNVSAWQKSAAPPTALHKDSKVPPTLLHLFALYENLLRFVFPLCTYMTDRPNLESPITATANIVDISGVGLKQFWNLKGHMQAASTLATAHYPETLDRIFVCNPAISLDALTLANLMQIIGAPSFFPTVWGWVKRWFDPGTTSKIFILGQHEVASTLTSLIEPENVPKCFGGTLDWEWGDYPNLGENEKKVVGGVQEKAGAAKWLKGPLEWRDEDKVTGEPTKTVAVGTVGGKLRREDVAIAERMHPAGEKEVFSEKQAERTATVNGGNIETNEVSDLDDKADSGKSLDGVAPPEEKEQIGTVAPIATVLAT